MLWCVRLLSLKATKRFSSGVAVTVGARLLMAANSVIAGVLLARLLGAESLGTYLVLSVAVQVLIQISGFALHLGNTYFVSRTPEKLIPIAVNSALFAVLSGGVCAAIVLVFVGVLLPGVSRELAFVGLLAIPFQLITSYVMNLFLVQGEVTKFNSVDLANQSFVLINAIVVLLIIGGGVPLLVTLNTATSIAMTIVVAAMFYRSASARFPEATWRGDASIISPMLRYSLKGFVLWVSTFLVYRLDLTIVNYFRGTAEAGVYAVATQCTLFLLLIPHAISHLLQVRVSATQDEGGGFSCRVARNTSVLLFAACLVSVPGAFLISAVYGPGFSDLPVQLWILLPGVYLLGIQLVLSQYFIGTGMPLFLPMTWVATLVLNVVLNLFIVPGYGARGAALASTICYTGISLVVLVLFKARTVHSLRSILVPTLAEIRSIPGMLIKPNAAGEP